MPQLSTSSNQRDGGIPVFTKKNRVGGFIMPDHTLFKRITGSIHMVKKFDGIGFNNEVLEAAEHEGIERVRIKDAESGVEYVSTVSIIRVHGEPFFHRDYGVQTVLPRKFWQKRHPDGIVINPDPGLFEPELKPDPAQSPAAEQLSLFGGMQ